MRVEITAVDWAPADLYEQVPFAAELLRELPGPSRPDYWLARLERPLRWADGPGGPLEVRFIVLTSRYAGETIRGHAGHLVVGIAYVTDDAQVALPEVDMARCVYAAVGEAELPPRAG